MKRLLTTTLLTLAVVGSLGWSKARRGYTKVLAAHTNKVRIYHHLATAMNGNVTLLAPRMRDALAAERDRLLRPTDQDRAAFAQRMADDGAKYHEVVLSIDSALPGGQQFGPGDAHWNLRMLVDGTDANLVAVEHVRRPTPLHRSLYAHHDQWSELWIARFDRVEDSPDLIELIISSGYGNKTLKWKL